MTARAGRVPTLRLALAFALAAGAVLAASAVLPPAAFRPAALVTLLVALAAAVADAAGCPRAGEVRVGRRVPGPLCLGRPATVTVGLRWSPRGRAGPRPLWWTDDAPQSVCRRAPAGRARIRPGEQLAAAYPILPERRGPVAWAGPRFTIGSPLGLWRTRIDAGLTWDRTVYPATARLAGSSGRSSPRGQPSPGERGLEFDGVRPYLPGEDAQHMDWRATARWDQPVVRRLRPERGRRIVLVIDAGRRSAQVPGEWPQAPTRLDVLCDAAMAVARTALAAGDAVGVMLLGSPRAVLPPRQGTAALQGLAALLAGARASADDADIARAVTALLAMPCEAVLWLGEAPSWREAAPMLRYLPPLARRRSVAFLEVGPVAPALLPEGERSRLLRSVLGEAAHERQAILRALARHGIRGRDVPPPRAAATAVRAYERLARGVAG